MVEILKGVIEKLILFSIAIVVIPLALLFLSLHGYFDGELAYAWMQRLCQRLSCVELRIAKTEAGLHVLYTGILTSCRVCSCCCNNMGLGECIPSPSIWGGTGGHGCQCGTSTTAHLF